MTIAQKLKKLRTDRKLRQVDVAAELGVGLNRYKKWEQGYTRPSPEMREIICNYYGIDSLADDAGTEVDTRLAKTSEKCRKCDYLWGNRSSGTVLCDYFERTGKLRGCPPGDECTKFKPRKGYRTYGKDFKI